MSEEEKKESPLSTDDNSQKDQQLNAPSTVEPIIPVAETSEIINHTSDINDMEVHHHTHAAHGKKT